MSIIFVLNLLFIVS